MFFGEHHELIILLFFTKVNGFYKYLHKNYENNLPIYYIYSNKTSSVATTGKIYDKQDDCILTCKYKRCKGIDLEIEGLKVRCSFFYGYTSLVTSAGKWHISTKPLPVTRFCEHQEQLCGLCECIDTIESARPYICDCRNRQNELDHYKEECNATLGTVFTKSAFYTIRPRSNDEFDVLCEKSNENVDTLVVLRTKGTKLQHDLEKYMQGFGWDNEYMLGFEKMKKLTDVHKYSLIVEFWSEENVHSIGEYSYFKILDATNGIIQYDSFKRIQGSMVNIIPRSGSSTLIACHNGFWWSTNCDRHNIFHKNAIIWYETWLSSVKISLRREKAPWHVYLLSEKKPSTSYGNAVGTSLQAFDGNVNTIFHSCSTPPVYYPWVQVDLLSSFKIHYIIIYNRKDCCRNRLRNGVIQASNVSQISDYKICNSFDQITASNQIGTFYCQSYIVASYVRLVIGPLNLYFPYDSSQWCLNIREMQVFGW